MSSPVDATQLVTPTTAIQRVRYFPIELYCTNLLPNSVYDIFMDGANVNGFCKPFGGVLGDPLLSDNMGKLRLQFMFSIPFNQNYLATATPDNNLVQAKKMITLRNVNGHDTVSYISTLVKAA